MKGMVVEGGRGEFRAVDGRIKIFMDFRDRSRVKLVAGGEEYFSFCVYVCVYTEIRSGNVYLPATPFITIKSNCVSSLHLHVYISIKTNRIDIVLPIRYMTFFVKI